MAAAMTIRADEIAKQELYKKYLFDYVGSDPVVLEICQEQALDVRHIRTAKWKPNLEHIATSYAENVICPACTNLRSNLPPNAYGFPVSIAEAIVQHAERLPIAVVALAEARCRAALSPHIIPVGETAKKDGWFA
jgi:hypothetical protein